MREPKIYKLDDGRKMTIYEIMALTGVSKKTTWGRLQKTRDFAELSKPTRPMKERKKREPYNKNYFEDTYADLSPELFKLLFGKWSTNGQ